MAVPYCVEKLWRGPQLRTDRGYAWVILIMSFLSHFAHVGISLALLGNLTVKHQEYFGINLQQSSTIGAVHNGLLFLFGPVASVLVRKLGCRITEIAGGVCLIIGFGVSSLSTEPWHAYVLFGVLAAFGVSTTYTASSEILARHFDRHKYLAFSVAALGYYVGMAVWPIVSQKLFDDFGYSRAMGLMATVHIIHILAGVLFYQPSADEDTGGEKESSDIKEKDGPEKFADPQKKGEDNPAIITDDEDLTKENKDLSEENKPTRNGDKESTQNTSVTNISDAAGGQRSLLNDFKMLLTLYKVWAFLITALLASLAISTFLILINDFVLKTTDMNSEDAALGITILGIANIIGALVVVGTSKLSFDRLHLHIGAVGVHGTATLISAFINGKAMYYALTAVWGVGQGIHIANLLAVIHDYCGATQLALLFGLHLCAEGVGALIGAPISSAIEKASTAKYGIIFAGACGLLGALVLLPVAIIKARKAKTAGADNQAPDVQELKISSIS